MRRREFLAASTAALATACASSDPGPDVDDQGRSTETVSTAGPTASVDPGAAASSAPTTSSQTSQERAIRAAAHLARLGAPPFAIGVGSGDPGPSSVQLWTRLVGADTTPVTTEDTEVEWTLATDPELREVVGEGRASCLAADGHVVRVRVDDVPNGPLYYGFRWQGEESPVGRTSTTTLDPDLPVRLGLVSCQHYEEGHFGALRHLALDSPDLVLHVGDAVYGRPGNQPVARDQPIHSPQDLADYRLLHEFYRRDPNCQLLHAAAPVAAVWDDHEVAQDDAGSVPEPRREPAYRAWREHQASDFASTETGIEIHRSVGLGDIATVWLLDGRQFRSDQACGRLPDLPAFERCDAVDDPARTMLGEGQEAWLADGIRDDGRWHLVAQQTVVSDMSISLGDSVGINNDQWDGYAAARLRLLDTVAGAAKSVVLSGDIHASVVAVAGDESAGIPEVAEVVAPSVTTRMPETVALGLTLALALRSNIRHFDPEVHGYVLLDVTPDRIDVTLRAVDTTVDAERAETVGRWFITPGDPVPKAI